MKKIIEIATALICAALMLAGCGDYSESSSAAQTEEIKKVKTQIIVQYDESLGELLFGNEDVFHVILDDTEIGNLSANGGKEINKGFELEPGYHNISIKTDVDDIFAKSSKLFNVKETNGVCTVTFEIDKNKIELLETHVEDNDVPKAVKDAQQLFGDKENGVYTKLVIYYKGGFVNALTNELQPYTIFLDDIEIGHFGDGENEINEIYYLSPGTHVISAKENNTDIFSVSSISFKIKEGATASSFKCSLNYKSLTNRVVFEECE